jgi:hypothetical protein
MRKLKGFIKRIWGSITKRSKYIWSNKFEVLNFIFTWVLPLVFIGTKVKYIEVHIAWKLTIYGILALTVLFIGLRKKIREFTLRKYGVKSLRDYFIKRKYGFIRWFGLNIIKFFKLGIITFIFYLMSRLTENLVQNWLLIVALAFIGSMFGLVHNMVKKEKPVIELGLE